MSESVTKSKTWKSYLFQVALVTFSVLLALLINEWRQDIKNKALVAQAVKTIRDEISTNRAEIEEKLPMHEQLYTSIQEKKIGNIGLNVPILRDTALEIIEASGASPHLKYSDLVIISEIHEMQITYKQNIAVISQLIYSKMFTLSASDFNEFLRGYSILIGDVINFEKVLLSQYTDALAQLSQ